MTMQRIRLLKVGGTYSNHWASLDTAVIRIVSSRLVHRDSLAGRDKDSLDSDVYTAPTSEVRAATSISVIDGSNLKNTNVG
jgi:hypothetical protein